MKKENSKKMSSDQALREKQLIKEANDIFSCVHRFAFAIRNREQPDRSMICEQFGVPKTKFDKYILALRPLLLAQILDDDAILIERVCKQFEISESVLAKNINVLRKANPKIKIELEKGRGMYVIYGKHAKLKVPKSSKK